MAAAEQAAQKSSSATLSPGARSTVPPDSSLDAARRHRSFTAACLLPVFSIPPRPDFGPCTTDLPATIPSRRTPRSCRAHRRPRRRQSDVRLPLNPPSALVGSPSALFLFPDELVSFIPTLPASPEERFRSHVGRPSIFPVATQSEASHTVPRPETGLASSAENVAPAAIPRAAPRQESFAQPYQTNEKAKYQAGIAARTASVMRNIYAPEGLTSRISRSSGRL